jgi:uncharacterized membrane protein YkgB
MNAYVELAGRWSTMLLRVTLGIVLLWIGALKFFDPSPVVGLLDASLSFLAFPAIVYVLGVVEVICAILLFGGFAVRYVGVVLVGLFAGTLLIFLIAPAVSYGEGGFPMLSLAGEFLLKDTVLMAAAVTLIGTERPGTAAASHE